MGKCDCPKSKPKKNGCKKKPTCEPPPPPPPPPPPNPFEPLIRSVDGVATLMSQMKEYICNLNPDDEMEMLAGDGTSGVNIILINLLYGVTLLNELCSDEDQRVLDLPKEQMRHSKSQNQSRLQKNQVKRSVEEMSIFPFDTIHLMLPDDNEKWAF